MGQPESCAGVAISIMSSHFDHEKLRVYQESLKFIDWFHANAIYIPKSAAVHNQIDRASTSIPLNIAEGNGKYQKRDKCRFFDIACGSALECAACLDVLKRKGYLSDEAIDQGKVILKNIVSMIMALIKSNMPERVYEEESDYGRS